MKYDGWTTSDIPDLTGKIFVVTGGNSGLGYESVKEFSRHNATVIMASRSQERGEQAITKIKEEIPNAKIDLMILDLSDSASIKHFAEEFKEKYQQLDVLLNNAGIMTPPYTSTKDGLESQIGVNHFGHFLLTYLLFDVIKQTPQSRIVITSSIAHKYGNIKFHKFPYVPGARYSKYMAYAQSKLANLLFMYQLNRLVQAKGLNIKVLASHPGISSTNLGRHLKKGFLSRLTIFIPMLLSHSQDKGAQPGIRACTDEHALSGQFYGPNGFFEAIGKPVITSSTKRSHNKLLQEELWRFSEEFWQINFDVS